MLSVLSVLNVLSVHVCHLLGFFVIHCDSMALVHYIIYIVSDSLGKWGQRVAPDHVG